MDYNNQPETITAQEIMDRVWQRFVVEGAPRGTHGPDGFCAYRAGPNACAVGILLTDEEADRASDDYVREVARKGRLPARLMPHLDMLDLLQRVHDRRIFADTAIRPAVLREVAAACNLTVPDAL